jgi:hypothetical protein
VIYYAQDEGGGIMLIIGNKELKQIKTGEPLKTPDNHVLICWVPDIEWTENEFRAMLRMGKGKVDPKIMSYIMVEALKQPEVLESTIVKPKGSG